LKRPRYPWLKPIILATQEAEIRRITVPSQPRQMVREMLSRKNPSQKGAGGVAQGVGPEFNTHTEKKKKRKAKKRLKNVGGMRKGNRDVELDQNTLY
jgi:hypothetical protein